MPEESLKTKTISSMMWTATQRFGVLILSFVSNLVLAWYLSAEDFGAVGMISIFISKENVEKPKINNETKKKKIKTK